MTGSAPPRRIGLLGTGVVGETLGNRLVPLGYQVFMGSRDPSNPKAAAWAKKAGQGARHGTFRQAVEFGEIVINATLGGVSLEVLNSAGAENLNGKILIDAANAIDLKTGVLPYGSDTSLAEQIQKAFPQARVVKSLNTMNVSMMLGQESYPGHHNRPGTTLTLNVKLPAYLQTLAGRPRVLLIWAGSRRLVGRSTTWRCSGDCAWHWARLRSTSVW